jgi:hypothetical protein
MDSLKLSDRVILPRIAPVSQWQFPLEFQWPTDYRRVMHLSFIVSFFATLVNIWLNVRHPRQWSLLQNVLIGPIFNVHMALISGLASWTIWKGKSWARGWATAASLLFILMFVRQFVVTVRPGWDHHVSELIVGMLGLFSFWWPARVHQEGSV